MIFKEPKKLLTVLPTEKPHVSYSELFDWVSCSFRHKLKYIDKIQLDKGSIHTIYGQVAHDALENRINFRKGLLSEVEPVSTYKKQFTDDFVKFLKEEIVFPKTLEGRKEKTKLLKMFKAFRETFGSICDNVLDWLDIHFENDWIPVDAEVQIYEPISEQENGFFFKGFIDLVIKVPKYSGRGKNRKKVEGEYVYFILDWKSTEWGWTKANKESHIKQVQLLCYKNYFSKIKGIPLEDISCGWILVKRKPKKGELPFELIPVTSTIKKVDEAVFLVRQMITSLLKELYFKNHRECYYCAYRTSGHCDISKVQT